MKTTEEIINSFEHLCFCGKENEVTFVPKNNLNISKVKKWYSEEELREIISFQEIDDEKGLIDGLSNNSIKYLLKKLFGDEE